MTLKRIIARAIVLIFVTFMVGASGLLVWLVGTELWKGFKHYPLCVSGFVVFLVALFFTPWAMDNLDK